ncbi:MAG: PIN domain-containing protein [Bacteroidota bacterium]|nr:PIN domain-containing protein [Bacteroidota bacterium]
MDNIFIDSNIILYLFDFDTLKRLKAKEIIALNPKINSQVLVEVVNVCKRKFNYSKLDCLNIWNDLHDLCQIVPINGTTTIQCKYLVEKYDFQIYDALIVASALETGCKYLFSEDMKHNLKIENQLTIINPFL